MTSANYPVSIPGLPARGKRHAVTTLLSRLLWLCLFAVVPAGAVAQTNQWTWMGGYSDLFAYLPNFTLGGHYGTLGVPSAMNIPGMREGAATWTDKSGNLWLFGGTGFGANNSNGYMNDMWKFNPSTNEWAWMGGDATVEGECTPYEPPSSSGGSPGYACGAPGVYGAMGVAAAGNTPGGREYAVSWTDKNGFLWLFGGLGYEPRDGVAIGMFNDLWKFNPSTLRWAWMGGSATVPGYYQGQAGVYGMLGVAAKGNVPGGRYGATGSVDPGGNFWLFGGYGANSSGQVYPLNDLWEYNAANGSWTWVSGSSSFQGAGIYGQLGVTSMGDVPGSRQNSASWIDAIGRFWLFGGQGNDSANNWGTYLNDLWQFDPSSGFWTWMGGSNLGNQGGNYGPLGQAGTGYIPSGRYEMQQWTDASGRLWLLGGRGENWTGAPYQWGDLNDLWRFDPISLKWTWMSGSKGNNNYYFGPGGVYGMLGTPAAANTPGGRALAAAWTDGQGNLWLFSGEGSGANGDSWGISPNDMWRYQLASTTSPKAATPSISPVGGSYTAAQQVSIHDGTANAIIYYSTGASATNPLWNAYTGPITVSASQTLSAIAMAPGYSTSQPASATYKLPTATPVFNLPSGTYNQATVKLTCATLGATIYYTTNGKAPTTSSTVYGGQIEVTSSETIEAMAVAAGSLNSGVATATYTIATRTVATNEWTWMGGASLLGKYNGEIGVYGTLGSFAAANIPGSRQGEAVWTDKWGNHWLFGGQGFDSAGGNGNLNDLWEMSVSTGQWAWMGGSNKVVNGSSAGGIYGTRGVFAAGNYPGSRHFATAWTDKSGYIWLFGGNGFDAKGVQNNLNDLWVFDPSTKMWAWMSGANVLTCPGSSFSGCAQAGSYGILGASSSSNVPSSRDEAAGWLDAYGNLWMFGGNGTDSLGEGGSLNDMWEFNRADNQWIWMGGSDTIGARQGRPGIYGLMGVPSAENIPGARYGSGVWTDAGGHLWLFGGWGYDSNGLYGRLNDLWEFNPNNDEWAWMSGAKELGFNSVSPGEFGQVSGVYGIQGVPAAGNMPGGREFPNLWQDKSGNVWLFGGDGTDAVGNWGYLNDLWVLNPTTGLWTWMQGASQAIVVDSYGDPGAPGAYGILGVQAAGNDPGGRYEAVNWLDSAGNLWLMGGWGSDSTGALGSLNDLWKYQPVAPAPPAAAPTFSLPSGYYTTAQTVTIRDATPGAKIYYTTNGTPPNANSTLYTGSIKVSQTTVIEAIALAAGYSPSAPVAEIYIVGP